MEIKKENVGSIIKKYLSIFIEIILKDGQKE